MSIDSAILLELYRRTREEITRYRDYEWKITAYVGALLVWIVTMSLNGKVVNSDTGKLERIIWSYISLIICVFGVFSLVYVHLRLNRNRNMQSKLEFVLGLHKPDNLISDSTAIPSGWDKEDFRYVFPENPRKKIRGLTEGLGIVFLLCFLLFLISLCVYANLVIWR